LGNVKNFIPLCLLADKHPGTEHAFVLSADNARNNTKIIPQSRYSYKGIKVKRIPYFPSRDANADYFKN
jgi:hypothetical protein